MHRDHSSRLSFAAILVACLLGLSPALCMAKDTKTAYYFYDDGGEHLMDSCAAKALPAKLVKSATYRDTAGYAGSVETASADDNEDGVSAFEHYFSSKPACAQALATSNRQYQ